MPKTEETLQLVEALIFASPDPIGGSRLVEILTNVSSDEIHESIETLNREYEESDRSFRILKGAGGYRFTTLARFGPWVKRLVYGSSRVKLSTAALETLSVIAYKQPVTRMEIENVRGVDASGILRMLLERKLIAVAARNPDAGRALRYTTTGHFLRYFGIDSLNELPQPSEMAEIDADHVSAGQESTGLFSENKNTTEPDTADSSTEEE